MISHFLISLMKRRCQKDCHIWRSFCFWCIQFSIQNIFFSFQICLYFYTSLRVQWPLTLRRKENLSMTIHFVWYHFQGWVNTTIFNLWYMWQAKLKMIALHFLHHSVCTYTLWSILVQKGAMNASDTIVKKKSLTSNL